MENVELKEGYSSRFFGNKTFAIENTRDHIVYCPFCYNQVLVSDSKCGVCNKNIPESIYFHSDDQTWIASGNETV